MAQTNELWQIYTEQGEPLHGVALPKEQTAKGILHASVHVWCWRLYNSQPQLLLQRRANQVKTWPGYYSISAAGHINGGEQPIAAALREAKEELNLHLRPEDLQLMFVNRELVHVPETTIVENELQWVYAAQLPADSALVFADKEVSAIRWAELDEIHSLAQGVSLAHVVPRGQSYFTMLAGQIERIIAAEQHVRAMRSSRL